MECTLPKSRLTASAIKATKCVSALCWRIPIATTIVLCFVVFSCFTLVNICRDKIKMMNWQSAMSKITVTLPIQAQSICYIDMYKPFVLTQSWSHCLYWRPYSVVIYIWRKHIILSSPGRFHTNAKWGSYSTNYSKHGLGKWHTFYGGEQMNMT